MSPDAGRAMTMTALMLFMAVLTNIAAAVIGTPVCIDSVILSALAVR